MAGLDAREKERRIAERPAGGARVVGLAEVRLRHGVLVLQPEQRLPRLRIGLRADARARLLGKLHQQWPEKLDETPGKRKTQLDRLAGGHLHDQPVLLGLVLDLELMQPHGPMVPLMRCTNAVVEWSCSKGIDSTRPPRASTSAAPTMRSIGQSPPFTSTSGRQARISAAGVSSSHQVTALTPSSAARGARRGAGGGAQPVGERVHRPVGSLAEAAGGAVAIQRYEQARAFSARASEIRDMAAVQEIEDAVGEDERALQPREPARNLSRIADLRFEGRGYWPLLRDRQSSSVGLQYSNTLTTLRTPPVLRAMSTASSASGSVTSPIR